MLRQVISRLRNASRKVNNRSVARAAFRRRLFVESPEDRRLLALFAPEVLYNSGGAYPYNLAVADFNVDGKTDVAAANISSASVGVLKNAGVGTFTDTGSLDTFTLSLDWGDALSPNNTQTFSLGTAVLTVADREGVEIRELAVDHIRLRSKRFNTDFIRL